MLAKLKYNMTKTFKKSYGILAIILFGFISIIVNIFGNRSNSILFSGDNIPFGIEKVSADVPGGGEGGLTPGGGEGSCGGSEGSGGGGSCD